MIIQEKGELPKWQRVKHDIELKIITGEYKDGELVPSVRKLSQLYNIGTSTSRIILERLAFDGTLIMEQGIGYRVNGNAINDLREKHLERLYNAFEEACSYAKLMQVNPKVIIDRICDDNDTSDKTWQVLNV